MEKMRMVCQNHGIIQKTNPTKLKETNKVIQYEYDNYIRYRYFTKNYEYGLYSDYKNYTLCELEKVK